jgi:hypothetical protein
VPIVEKFWEPEPPSQGCRGIALPSKLISWGAALLYNHDVYLLQNFLIDNRIISVVIVFTMTHDKFAFSARQIMPGDGTFMSSC